MEQYITIKKEEGGECEILINNFDDLHWLLGTFKPGTTVRIPSGNISIGTDIEIKVYIAE